MISISKINPILPYNSPQKNETTAELFMENRRRISISGVQEKLSMVSDKNGFRLANEGEQGTYILKLIPQDLKKSNQIPVNENLTMQIARQVYKINTAENGLVFFKDGVPAYIITKYDYSYEEAGCLIQKYVPAWRVEIEKYFSLVVFNYLFSNGDAHLKNFSLLETVSGDYLLSPAYDLINTRLHVEDTDFALDKGLFADGFRSDYYRKRGHAGKTDFETLAGRLGISMNRTLKLLSPFLQTHRLVEQLIKQSNLPEPDKRGYYLMYQTRMNFFAEK